MTCCSLVLSFYLFLMNYRQFGKTDLFASEIGFGAWAIGGGAMIGNTAIGWGRSDDDTSIKAIHASLNAGINFFDTADIYGLGHSEELLGKTLEGQTNIIIATKGGNVSRNNEFTVDYSAEHLIKACENSLRRLKRETIDYYQLHTARLSHLEQGYCIDAMQFLQKQGKIRYWGSSLNTFDPEPEAKYLMETEKGSGFQLVLNLLNQKALHLLPMAAEKGYGIIARMPLQFGLLTGKFDEEVNFPENDHRKNRLTPEIIKACAHALAPIWQLCKKYNCNKTQLSLSYILSYSPVSVVIPGIRTAAQVNQNCTGSFKLDKSDMELIEDFGMHEGEGLLQMIKKQG
jgi:aryl-alcohol dehydrogenase-like predicted oxidoreductase